MGDRENSTPGWIEGGDEPRLPFSESDTSRAAAIAIAPKAGSMRARVMMYLLGCGDAGSTDYEGYTRLDMRQVSYGARRNEMLNNPKKGEPRTVPAWVYDTGRRRKADSGMDVTVWALTPEGIRIARALSSAGGTEI